MADVSASTVFDTNRAPGRVFRIACRSASAIAVVPVIDTFSVRNCAPFVTRNTTASSPLRGVFVYGACASR